MKSKKIAGMYYLFGYLFYVVAMGLVMYSTVHIIKLSTFTAFAIIWVVGMVMQVYGWKKVKEGN